MFSGSYPVEDVTFLLKVIDLPPIGIAEKERLIQSGERHYSEMIGEEEPPSAQYLELFNRACVQNNARFADHLVTLARHVAEAIPGEITLVSLARAGTPVGVLLNRIIRDHLHRAVRHYSISIIRDRGIDEVALRYILRIDKRPPSSIVFVDGWTGKGVIAKELRAAVAKLNHEWDTDISSSLHVVADLSGTAGAAATTEDYLIPSSILNAVVSGLISRSILNVDYIGEDDFHGCRFYREFAEIDLSRCFVEAVMDEVRRMPLERWGDGPGAISPSEQAAVRNRNTAFVTSLQQKYRVRSHHHIKPGIGEATRVLLRRVPERLLLRTSHASEVAHLIQLAEEKRVPWEEIPTLAYQAAAIIREHEATNAMAGETYAT